MAGDGQQQNGNGFTGKWQNVITAGMFLLFVGGAFWTLAFNPVNSTLAEVKETQRSLSAEFKELRQNVTALRTELTEYRATIGKDIQRNETNIAKIDGLLVPWKVHELQWQNQNLTIGNVDARIAKVERALGDSYSLADKLKELQRIVEGLQSRQNGRPAE